MKTAEQIRAEIDKFKRVYNFRLEYDPTNTKAIDYVINRINKLEAELEELKRIDSTWLMGRFKEVL
jgi:hypothetical protein